jgi:hypothetical protein
MTYRVPEDAGVQGFVKTVAGRITVSVLVVNIVIIVFLVGDIQYVTSGFARLLTYVDFLAVPLVAGASLYIQRHGRVGWLMIGLAVVTFVVGMTFGVEYFDSIRGRRLLPLFFMPPLVALIVALTIYEARIPQRILSGLKTTYIAAATASVIIFSSHFLAPDEALFEYALLPELIFTLVVWLIFAVLDDRGLWRSLSKAWYYFWVGFFGIIPIWIYGDAQPTGELLVLGAAGVGCACWVIGAVSLKFIKGRVSGDLVALMIVALILIGNFSDIALR